MKGLWGGRRRWPLVSVCAWLVLTSRHLNTLLRNYRIPAGNRYHPVVLLYKRRYGGALPPPATCLPSHTPSPAAPAISYRPHHTYACRPTHSPLAAHYQHTYPAHTPAFPLAASYACLTRLYFAHGDSPPSSCCLTWVAGGSDGQLWGAL